MLSLRDAMGEREVENQHRNAGKIEEIGGIDYNWD
jgi:hypothetical protein